LTKVLTFHYTNKPYRFIWKH